MQPKSKWNYFGGSIAFTILAVIGGFLIGGWVGVYEVLILGLLEASLSVDNAVLNAKVLGDMSTFWRRMFVTVGMLIAVFGMRVLFPVAIVSTATDLGLWQVVQLALHQPDQYAAALKSTHVSIAGFGGAFLLLVFLEFMVDAEKDEHWLSWIEGPLTKLGQTKTAQTLIALLTIWGTSHFIPAAESSTFFFTGVLGVITFMAVDFIGSLLETEETDSNGAVNLVRSGLAGFIYLEVLDASCSFDGVIGAFAVSNSILLIALGLGIGAFFVRSLTLMLVDNGALDEFKYLEHGAFWAIGSLAAIIMVSAFHEVPDVVAGTIGALFIGAAFVSSVMHNRNEAALQLQQAGGTQ